MREVDVFVRFALADFVLEWLVADDDAVLLAGVAVDAVACVKAIEHTRIVTLEATVLFSHDPANLIRKPQSPSKAGFPTLIRWDEPCPRSVVKEYAVRSRHWKSSLNWEPSASDRRAIIRLRKCTCNKDRAVLSPRPSGPDQEDHVLPALQRSFNTGEVLG